MSVGETEPAIAFDEPDGLAARGTLVVLGGRGETTAVYRRFGTRLAADAYRVRVLTEREVDRDRVRSLLEQGEASPRVLVGSDTGALRAVELAGDPALGVDGLVLAGTPVGGARLAADDWDEELDARTACPVHRGRLTDGTVQRGALADEVPAELLARARASRPAIPILALHGEADPISPFEGARDWLSGLEQLELVRIGDGRHDALNDASHRSVAAAIVLWLERLRGAPTLVR